MPAPLPVLVLAGPTAAGKTDAAMELARRWGARIVSADAMQVYRGMDIGTGKATPEELERFPHACVDVRDPDEPYSAQDFARDADREVQAGGPIAVAGGTVFYLRAFLYGLVPTPPVDPTLRARLEALEDPWSALREVDPTLAARLHPHDRVRIVRGLEVFYGSGQRLSDLHARDPQRPRHPHRVLWLDRDDLRARIDLRVEQMMDRGYLDEVRGLLEAGYDRGLKPMQSLGYRHLADHLLDGLELQEAIWRTRRDTWRFARKQRGWSRQHPGWERVDARERDTVLRWATELWGPPPR
jgi:tRNA dimethylallyltransferase